MCVQTSVNKQLGNPCIRLYLRHKAQTVTHNCQDLLPEVLPINAFLKELC